MRRIWFYFQTSLLLIFTVSSLGCSTTRPSLLGDLFAVEDTSYKSNYGQTPAQRVEELRALAANASSIPPQQQSFAVMKLTEQINAEPNPMIRKELVMAAGAFSDPHPLPALHAAIADPDAMVRKAAYTAWSRRNTEEAFAVLAHAMSTDSSVDVRQTATKALANFRSPEAMRRLAAALDDKDPATQLLAIQSLEESTGQRLGNNTEQWRNYVAQNFGAPTQDASGSGTVMMAAHDDDATWK